MRGALPLRLELLFIGFDLIPFRDYVKGMYPPVYDPSDFTSYATVWLDN